MMSSMTFAYCTLAFILLLVLTGVPRPVIPWLIALEIVVLALVGAIG